eukprot:10026329-Lingulodinium_polyedra.AAC.1
MVVSGLAGFSSRKTSAKKGQRGQSPGCVGQAFCEASCEGHCSQASRARAFHHGGGGPASSCY